MTGSIRNSVGKCIHFAPAIKLGRFAPRLEQMSDCELLFDLEDSVAEKYKDEARELLVKWIKRLPRRTVWHVRVNSVRSKWFDDDCAALSDIAPDRILLPKAESVDEVKLLAGVASELERSRGRPVTLFVAIESIEGYFRHKEILTASDRIALCTVGYEDLSAELGIERPQLWETGPLNEIINNVLISAKYLGIPFFDATSRVFQADRLNELVQEVEFGKRIGCSGKVSIHPSQISIINRIYDDKQVLKSSARTVELFEHLEDGSAVIVNDKGEMEDNPSLRRATSIMRREIE